jgi:hypothetical protein
VIENKANRRPDIVVLINGLPLGVIELKNPADENATIDGAFNQLQTYKAPIPSLFRTNAALVISDDLSARIGSLTADRERFMPWRSILGQGRVLGARGGGNGRRALRRPRHDAQPACADCGRVPGPYPRGHPGATAAHRDGDAFS